MKAIRIRCINTLTKTLITAATALFLTGQLATNTALAAQKEFHNPFYSSVPSAYMEDPRRIEWQKPEQVIDHLFIKQGNTVADIGAGTGYFTTLFSQHVGKNGMVYAVDVDESMVKLLRNRTEKENLRNVTSILAKSDDPLLPNLSTDLVFICDTYLFLENRVPYLTRLRNSLKSGGRLAILSFNTKAEIPGAPPAHKMISKENTIQEVEKAGFALEAEYFFLPYHDFFVFIKR